MTRFQKFAFLFVLVVGFILAAGFSLKIGQKIGYKHGYSEALAGIKPDTVWRDTTIYEEKPVPEYHYRDTGSVVEIPITEYVHDTAYIYLPMEVKGYSGEGYELQVSGVQPNLDWIKVHQKTAYITVPVPEYKYPTFMLSPALDVLILPTSYAAGAGLELDYWINRWEFSGGGGYAIEMCPGESNRGLYGRFSARYNLIRK